MVVRYEAKKFPFAKRKYMLNSYRPVVAEIPRPVPGGASRKMSFNRSQDSSFTTTSGTETPKPVVPPTPTPTPTPPVETPKSVEDFVKPTQPIEPPKKKEKEIHVKPPKPAEPPKKRIRVEPSEPPKTKQATPFMDTQKPKSKVAHRLFSDIYDELQT